MKMKNMRIRKWLKSHKERHITLDHNDFMRIGKKNLIKITSIARKYKKTIIVITQNVYESNSLKSF